MNISKAVWGGGLLLLTSLAATQASLAETCTSQYAIVNQWSNGFQGEVFIIPESAALTSWTLTWTFPSGQTLTGLWNGVATQAGAKVTVNNESYNGTVPRGFSIDVKFVASITGTNTVPSDFALNGIPCTPPAPPPNPVGSGLNTALRMENTSVPADSR